MNHQLRTDLSLSAAARAVAQIHGIIRSFEQSQLIFCVTFLTLFLASIGLKAVTETAWTDVGSALGLSGLTLQLLCWLFRGKPTQDQNRPASVTITDGNNIISASDLDPKDVALAFKEIIQNRQILPAPHGEVLTTTGDAKAELRAYTEEEKRSISEQSAAAMREHDEKFLAQLDELIRKSGPPIPSLPNPTEPAPIPLATEEERTMVKPAST